MNNLRKIGLSALAGSLATFSVNAADLSVSGAASISFDDTNRGFGDRGNSFYKGDSLKFNGSGETDGGIGVAVYYELDGTASMDDHKLTLTGGFGTLVFDGHGGSSAFGAIDDKTPNAYEEAWDIIDTNGATAGGVPLVINGVSANNMFIYTTPDMGGASLTASYINGGGSDAAPEGSTSFALKMVPAGMDGLELGIGVSDNTEAESTDVDETTMYATYATGGITIGVQASDRDITTAGSDTDSIAYGITYAVNDDLSVGYSYHELETESSTDEDQKSTGFSASYTMGGMTLAGAMNDSDNMSGIAATDREGYEFTLSFAF
jgi:outer membrane protein OmpU